MSPDIFFRAMSFVDSDWTITWSDDDMQLLLTGLACMVGAGFIILILARGVAILLLFISMLIRFLAMLLSLVVNAIVDRSPGQDPVDDHHHGREKTPFGGTFHALQYTLAHSLDFQSSVHRFDADVDGIHAFRPSTDGQISRRGRTEYVPSGVEYREGLGRFSFAVIEAVIIVAIWIGVLSIRSMERVRVLFLSVKACGL